MKHGIKNEVQPLYIDMKQINSFGGRHLTDTQMVKAESAMEQIYWTPPVDHGVWWGLGGLVFPHHVT